MARNEQSRYAMQWANEIAAAGSLGYAVFCAPTHAIEPNGDDI
jgi:hypothetical protein